MSHACTDNSTSSLLFAAKLRMDLFVILSPDNHKERNEGSPFSLAIPSSSTSVSSNHSEDSEATLHRLATPWLFTRVPLKPNEANDGRVESLARPALSTFVSARPSSRR